MEVDPDNHKIVNPSETTRLVTEDNDFHSIERYDEHAAPRQITSTDLDVLYTFWIMKARQWERIHKGSYRNPQSFSKLWLVFFLAIYAAYLCLQIVVFHRTKNWILEFILMGMLSVTMSILVSRVIWFYKLMLLEAYTYIVIFFILDLYYQPAKYIPIGIATVGAIIVTFLVYIVYPYIFHCYIECTGSVTPKIGNSKEGVCMEDNARIEFEQGNCYSKSVQCVYQGPVRDGKPHGMGVWIDTSLQGEFLQGWWEEGIPRGPFESMENGTRSLLVNLRIFFACDAGGKFWLERIPLTYGVASVECCVSGNFFKSYPRVEVISGPEECKCPHKKCTCVGTILKGKQYRHIDDEKHLKSVVVTVEKRGITVTGHKSQKEFHDRVTISAITDKESPKLILDEDWLSSTTTEALLFIHGYDHNLDDALKRFGQFLALGHFPSYLKPFVFNWPSSTNPLFYWCAHSVASDNDIHRDLKKFIYSLRAAGIKTLHIMCHSMGTRFLLRSWASVKSLFDVRFLSPHSSYTDLDRIESQTAPGIQLQNLIFLNPDYEMTTFKNDYDELRPYCSRITIYADNRDSAIRLAFKMTNKVSLGSPANPLVDRYGKFLDIDLIDTSDLDRNTNSTFHSFFNINRLMVDDLWELIVTTKRAGERTSRLKRWGHVYRFSILPSSVVMV